MKSDTVIYTCVYETCGGRNNTRCFDGWPVCVCVCVTGAVMSRPHQSKLLTQLGERSVSVSQCNCGTYYIRRRFYKPLFMLEITAARCHANILHVLVFYDETYIVHGERKASHPYHFLRARLVFVITVAKRYYGSSPRSVENLSHQTSWCSPLSSLPFPFLISVLLPADGGEMLELTRCSSASGQEGSGAEKHGTSLSCLFGGGAEKMI